MIVARILRRLVGGTLRGMLHRWPTTLLSMILLVGGALALGGRGLAPDVTGINLFGVGESAPVASSDTREMTIEELRPARGGEQINLVLKEKSGNRRLVMVVGLGEAIAIQSDLSNARAERPMTYELMRSIVQQLGGSVNRVIVNNADATTFYAKVVMSADNRQIEVDSRPSDAIALALRTRAPIFAETSVLEKFGVLSSN